MEKLTVPHYEKEAVLRCASLLPKSGPTLDKDDFIRLVPFQKTARMLFKAHVLSEGEKGITINPLVHHGEATRNDIRFFYDKLRAVFSEEVIAFADFPDIEKLDRFGRCSAVNELMEELESDSKSKELIEQCDAFLSSAGEERLDDWLVIAFNRLCDQAIDARLRSYLATERGAARAATFFHFLQTDLIPPDEAIEDLRFLSAIYGRAGSGFFASSCAIRRLHLIRAQKPTPRELYDAKKFVAYVLDKAFGFYTTAEFIGLMRKEMSM